MLNIAARHDVTPRVGEVHGQVKFRFQAAIVPLAMKSLRAWSRCFHAGAGPPRDYRRPCGIAAAMWAAEAAYRESLAGVTVAALNDQMLTAAPPKQLVESATWLRNAIRPRERGSRT